MAKYNYKHGLTGVKLYKKWLYMKQRCYYKKDISYKNYGGRGIMVCSEWRNDFMCYYNYVKALPNAMKEGFSIDRIDNDGNYEPGNIRWIDKHTQQTNQRRRTDNSSGYTGVYKNHKFYASTIRINGKSIFIANCETIKDAVLARNNYILDNNLTEYKTQELKH